MSAGRSSLIELMSLNDTCPVKAFSFSKEKQPWLNHELIVQLNAIKLARRTGNPDDLVYARKIRNRTKNLINKAKLDYYTNQLNDNRDDPRKYWQHIYTILNKNKKDNKFNLEDHDGTVLDQKDVPDFINDFFTSIGAKLVNENPKMKQDYNLPVINDNVELFQLQEVNMDQLMSLLKQIKIYKSSGIDNVSSRILKDALINLNEQLLFLINLSINNNRFPSEWKKGTVIPLPKVSNPTNVGDLRPITLLPIPSKIIEKLVYSQIMNFLENNKYITDNQFGFRKNKSTIDASSKFVNALYSNENKKLITSAIFIDYKKAFDSISHESLLKKLKRFHISNSVINWIKNYLTGRLQRTMVNGKVSEWREVTFGVPQGSTLGPLLFLLFVDDVINLEIDSNCVLYADDIVLYCANNTIDNNLSVLKKDMGKVFDWSNTSRLTINFSKTKVMHFGHKAKKEKQACKIDEYTIEYVHSCRYLGFLLDQELTFKSDLKQTTRTISQKFYMFKKIKYFLTKKAKLDVAKAMLLSYFTYGNIFYGICNEEDRGDLQKLQNSILRSALEINNPRDISTVNLHF